MWDLAIDPVTCDFKFDSRRDLAGVTGNEIINQRILIRCKIPRGSFKMDETGTLGSTLYLVNRFHSAVDEEDDNEAIAATQEALEPMTDIQINEIHVHVTEDNRRLIHVHWQNASAIDEPLEEQIVPVASFTTTLVSE